MAPRIHMPELEKRGLLLANGRPIFKPGDRIDAIHTKKGVLQNQFDNPPGMFVTNLDFAGHGLEAFGTPRHNLVFLYGMYKQFGDDE